MAEATDFTKTLSDAAYVAVGFGVIAFQKAQVRRRELEAQFGISGGQILEQVAKVAGDLEERLPGEARELVSTARTTAKDAGAQLRTLISELDPRTSSAA